MREIFGLVGVILALDNVESSQRKELTLAKHRKGEYLWKEKASEILLPY